MSSNDYKQLKDKNSCDYFLETGYYMGSGVHRAIQAGFKKIFSIEISSIYVANGKKHYENNNKVKIIHDDSKNLYETIKDFPNKRFLFFLDAHADQTSEHEQSINCPILHELEAIRKHPIKNHVILVDDMRLFRSQSAWATGIYVEQILEQLHTINPNYKITFLKSFTENDVLCASIH